MREDRHAAAAGRGRSREALAQLRMGARPLDDASELVDLVPQDGPSLGGEGVIAALRLLSILGIRGARFLDQPAVQQPLNRFVKRARPEPDGAAGSFVDVLLDRVAMARPLGEREQDMDDRERKGLARPGRGLSGHRRIVRRYVYQKSLRGASRRCQAG